MMTSSVIVKKTDSYIVIIYDAVLNIPVYRREVRDVPILDWAFSDMVSEISHSERILNDVFIYGIVMDFTYVNSDGETLASINTSRYHFDSEELNDKLHELSNYIANIRCE